MSKIFICLILLINAISVVGQAKHEKTSPSDIIIEGETTDNLTIFALTIGSNTTTAPYSRHEFKVGNKALFKIVLPGTSDFTYVNFMTSSTNDVSSWNSYDNMYIMEKGDRITCKLSNEYYEFTGKGSEKLNCQSEIYRLNFSNNDGEIKLLQEERYKEYFSIIKRRMDSIYSQQIAVINKYAPGMGENMTKIMMANCYGNKYYTLLRSNTIKATRSSGSIKFLKAFLESEIYKGIDNDLNHKIDEKHLVASSVYCNFLLEKIIFNNLLDKQKDVLRPSIIDHVFNSITQDYKGLVREKLLTLFFFRFKANKGVLGYLDNALMYVKNKEFRDIVIQIKNITTKGSAFFPFELQDTKGNIVKLSDLKDKIVILDFWYTGCTWCKIQYQGMRPIIDKYKDNPKVAFVSISIDKNKDTWLKSVVNGDYTDPDGLNLYTNGLGAIHPVIEKNNISSYPAVFILKKGEIFSAKPPRLNSMLTEKLSTEAKNAFVKLIEEALLD
ncbi:redoxin domain-containing protein [Pedobacter sp. ASV1-7]|uniref:TlpA family protein disulfide reductase n=1 Tax=Pedobacter sp. ASV1-7 TaxID=3145237 RepID=UPI0032E8FE3D